MSEISRSFTIAEHAVETEAFRPTMMLRWTRPSHTTTAPDVLEQAWQGDRGTIRWQPVPLVIKD